MNKNTDQTTINIEHNSLTKQSDIL